MRSVNLGRRLGGTMGCVTFPTAELAAGLVIEVNLDSQFGSGITNATVTVS